jgi:caa(3)-type oxidase subunit IV
MKNTVATTVYTKVLGMLLLLTLLTFVQPSLFPLTPGKTALVQILISAMKIGLIVAYYMHLRSEVTYVKGYMVLTFVLLSIFFLLVGIDVFYS